jgi:hypothetical protein
MQHINDCAVCVMPPHTVATNATHTMTVDCADFDQMNVYVGMNTHATNKAELSVFKFTEGTNTSCGTAIVALTGGTVTSSSVGFHIDEATEMGPGAVVEFQIDLRKRKRYIDLRLTPGDTTANETYAIALLSRGTYSRDSYTEKYCKNYGSATSNTSVAQVVTA